MIKDQWHQKTGVPSTYSFVLSLSPIFVISFSSLSVLFSVVSISPNLNEASFASSLTKLQFKNHDNGETFIFLLNLFNANLRLTLLVNKKELLWISKNLKLEKNPFNTI